MSIKTKLYNLDLWTCREMGGSRKRYYTSGGRLAVLQLPPENVHTLLLFSHLVMPDSSWPHGLIHTRLLYPSPSPAVRPSSCSLYQWCHPAISSFVPFSSCFQSFPESGSFPMTWLSVSGGQSIGASASILPMNIQDWFPLGLTGLISLLSNKFILAVQGVHIWLPAIPHLRIYVKKMIQIVCKDLASGIFKTIIYNS